MPEMEMGFVKRGDMPKGVFTPTELGKMVLPPMSASAFNKLLETKGFHSWRGKGLGYKVSSAGDRAGAWFGCKNPSDRNKALWPVSIIKELGLVEKA